MSVLDFDKNELGNLEYSLQREMLATDRTGGYGTTTIVCCNTRKYHGLMVTPIDDSTDDLFVLLSSLDETVVQHDCAFNLALHRFKGVYEPRGHKYITDFVYTPCPTITYRVGGVVLRKEMMWVHSRTQLLIRYTLVEANSPTKLRLRPFLAFRNRHNLSKANVYANGHSYEVYHGVKNRLYDNFPWLYMQVSSESSEFIAAPDWYYNFEYQQELDRGYEGYEDLMTTGYFEVNIKKGESIIFSASTEEMTSKDEMYKLFEAEVARRSHKVDFLSCLTHSARQFIVRRGDNTHIVAGFPWFGSWGRDTFIALPGITLTQGMVGACVDALDTMCGQIQGGLFPNMGEAFNSVDAPLWFFWTLQRLTEYVDEQSVWEKYGAKMTAIIEALGNGVSEYIALHDNGLIWASHPHLAMTWMDAVVHGKPVTGREGYQVEINALWYNALKFACELSDKYGTKEWSQPWLKVAESAKRSFVDKFWLDEGYLADFVNNEQINKFIRSNQIIACSLKYKMLNEEQIVGVVKTVRQHLLTPRGLRTLSPLNPQYEGRYEGDQEARDRAYHQGTVWVWQLEHFVKVNFELYGDKFFKEAEWILETFEEELTVAGIGSISGI